MKNSLLFIFLFCPAAPTANGEKILRITFQAAETGFDPVKVHDYYSGTVIEAIFDPLLTYDYLARPAKLVANAAESLPEISADGRPYVFRIRQGIYFADDAAFKGRKRELTALDYAYSFKRFYDPRHRSPYAFLFTGAVAREAFEAYGDESPSHPVGSGPFLLKRYVRSSKIVLAANPDIEYQLWDVAPTFMTDDGKLRPEFVRRGIQLDRTIDPEITHLYFNMQERIGDSPNPVGGFGKERIALRRAIAMSYKVDDQIRIIRKGQAVRAEYPVPPGVAGHDPGYRSLTPYDPRAANALLEKFGYRKGPDGYRRQPDGAPLVIRNASSPTERDRQFDELLKRSLDSIGVRLEIQKERFPELLKLEKQCRLMTRMAAWIADYPDGDNFMQLLYGPNTHESNNACYRSEEFDRRYEKSRRLADGPERDRLYHEMTRRMEVDTVRLLADSRIRNALQQPQVVGFTKHPVLHAEWLYLDLAPKSGD